MLLDRIQEISSELSAFTRQDDSMMEYLVILIWEVGGTNGAGLELISKEAAVTPAGPERGLFSRSFWGLHSA